MNSEYIKRFSTSLIISGIQIKSKAHTCYHQDVIMVIINKKQTTGAGNNVVKREAHTFLVGMQVGQATMEIHIIIFKSLKQVYHKVQKFTCPEKMKFRFQKDICIAYLSQHCS